MIKSYFIFANTKREAKTLLKEIKNKGHRDANHKDIKIINIVKRRKLKDIKEWEIFYE